MQLVFKSPVLGLTKSGWGLWGIQISHWKAPWEQKGAVMASSKQPKLNFSQTMMASSKWPKLNFSQSIPFGGGFFLAWEDLGRMSDNSFPVRSCCFFFKVDISLRKLTHSLGQDQSKVAQRTETKVTECSLTSCVWARFRIGSHTMPGQHHSQPTPTSLDQGYMRVYVQPATCTFCTMTGIFCVPLR